MNIINEGTFFSSEEMEKAINMVAEQIRWDAKKLKAHTNYDYFDMLNKRGIPYSSYNIQQTLKDYAAVIIRTIAAMELDAVKQNEMETDRNNQRPTP